MTTPPPPPRTPPHSTLLGLHHVTAFAKDPTRCRAFYTEVLGLRLVKTTVNFDDPYVHHLYFGDREGTPGTLLTHFPHPHAKAGVHGAPEIATTLLRVADVGAWEDRLRGRGVETSRLAVFGEERVRFADHDTMGFALVGGGAGEGITGVAGVEVRAPGRDEMVGFLVETLGFEEVSREGERVRLSVGGDIGDSVIEVVRTEAGASNFGAGIVHHVAWRVADLGVQAAVVERMRGAGVGTTEVKDRDYFKSVYARVPGGVVFEFATDGPGFAVDEPVESLGERLCLPAMYEGRRAEIEAALPAV
ncbi:MAG: VOC family protein [Planctomycetota bacterium]